MKITEDMRADRDHLVETLQRTMGGDQGDAQIAWNDLRESGWADVFQRISGTWQQFTDQGRPTNRMPWGACLALLQTCGVFRASQVMAAIEVWIASADGGNPPQPADLFGLIAGRSRDPVQNARPGTAVWFRPETLKLVAELIGLGTEDPCDCLLAGRGNPPSIVLDDRGILWCPVCAGIEVGQVTEADLHVTPWDDGRDEPQDITATELLRQARLAKRQRLQDTPVPTTPEDAPCPMSRPVAA